MTTPESAPAPGSTPNGAAGAPRHAGEKPKDGGKAKDDKKSRPKESDALKAEIDQTRAELAATIQELSGRLAPGELAARAGEQAKQAASAAGEQARQAVADAGGLLRGQSLPQDEPDRLRNVKILAGAALVVGAFVGMALLRRRWR